jgi:hypothetical protein
MARTRYFDGFQWTAAVAPRRSGASAGVDTDSATVRMLLPVGRTSLSIVAGYVALFSVLLAPAPVALVPGVCALVQLNHRPGAYGRGRAIFAIVMGTMFTVALIASSWACTRGPGRRRRSPAGIEVPPAEYAA